MFDAIHNNTELSHIVRQCCQENDTAVIFGDALNTELVLILKPDMFYSSKNKHNPPPSPDCLILVHCADKTQYCLYIIELKDVKDTRFLKYEEIVAKFETMINQFFPTFKDIFENEKYQTIKFYLVTSYPKGNELFSEEEYRKKIANTTLDAYGSRKPLKLYNKAVLIEPHPALLTINPC